MRIVYFSTVKVLSQYCALLSATAALASGCFCTSECWTWRRTCVCTVCFRWRTGDGVQKVAHMEEIFFTLIVNWWKCLWQLWSSCFHVVKPLHGFLQPGEILRIHFTKLGKDYSCLFQLALVIICIVYCAVDSWNMQTWWHCQKWVPRVKKHQQSDRLETLQQFSQLYLKRKIRQTVKGFIH